MKTFFLEQAKKTSGIKSIIYLINKNENKIIINSNLSKTKLKKKIRIVKKIKDILAKERSRQIIIEKRLKEDKELINLIYGYNINICSPKWLFKQLINEVIEEILILKNKEKGNSEISICINEIDTKIEEYIYKFAKEFK